MLRIGREASRDLDADAAWDSARRMPTGADDFCVTASEPGAFGHCLETTAANDLDPCRGSDEVELSGRETLAEARCQLWACGEKGWLSLSRGGVLLRCPRRGDRLRQRHLEVDPVQQDLEDGRDDRGAAEAADGENGPAATQDDRRRGAAARPLPRRRQVGIRLRRRQRERVEFVQVVVEQKAVASNGDRAAAEIAE